jgi:hypothetical protein
MEIKRISNIISEEGILVFFSKVLRYIRKNICGVTKAFVYELDLNNPFPKFTSELELSFRLATEKDIDMMNYENYFYDKKAKQYAQERLKKGDSCVLTLYNGMIIAYVWIGYNDLDISKFNLIPLSKNRVSTYNCLTLNEFRGKKVNNSTDHYINDIVRKAGKRYVVVLIDKDNKVAAKTRERAGYKKIGFVNQIRFFGLKYDYIDKKLLSYLQKQ